jgi:hypothetical protein
LDFETGLAVVNSGGELDVGVGEENVRRDYIEISTIGVTHEEGLAIGDGGCDALRSFDLCIVVHQHLGTVGLAIDVDEQHFVASVAKPAAKEREVVVFETPPFCDAMECIIG